MLLNSINFKVTGVTFKNEEGKDVQKEIKRILNEYKKNDYFGDLYGGYTNSEIKEMDLNISEYEGYKFPTKIVGDEYNGEDCLKIYFKTYNDEYVHIGYAPKNILSELEKWLTKEDIKIDGTLEVIGGKYKYCELYEEDYEEKERVATKELTYGMEISINFYGERIEDKDELSDVLKELKKEEKNENSSYKDVKSEVEKVNRIENIIQIIVWSIIVVVGFFIFSKFYSFINWLLN